MINSFELYGIAGIFAGVAIDRVWIYAFEKAYENNANGENQ